MQVLVSSDLLPSGLQGRVGHEVVSDSADAVGRFGIRLPLEPDVLSHGLRDARVDRLEFQLAWFEVELVGVPVQGTQSTPILPQLGMVVMDRVTQPATLT
ncbi:hypothetical protein D3C85_1577150 [compost metagenome]